MSTKTHLERFNQQCEHCGLVLVADELAARPTIHIIESWAPAQGWWSTSSVLMGSSGRSIMNCQWTIEPDLSPVADFGVTIWAPYGIRGIRTPTRVALLWALLLEDEPLVVDVGRCPNCDGHGLEAQEHPAATTSIRHMLDIGWDFTGGTLPLEDNTPTKIFQRTCPHCLRSGRDVREVAKLWLDWTTVKPAMLGDLPFRHLRDALYIAADQAQPDLSGKRLPDRFPRGEWLALALAGKFEWADEGRVTLAQKTHRKTCISYRGVV